jgi:hypothetical protein
VEDVVGAKDKAAPEVSVAVNAVAEHRISDQMTQVEVVAVLCAKEDSWQGISMDLLLTRR